MDTDRFVNVCCNDRCYHARVRGKFGCSGSNIPQVMLAIALAVYMTGLAVAAPRKHAQDDRVVAKTVETYFASQPGYQNGDLITRTQIEQVITKLASAKVKVSNPTSVTDLGLASDSFLVREFSTPEGKKFMRKIAQQSGAYPHLDRLSTIPQGQKFIRDLVRLKDGDKMVEYLVSTKGGRNMSGMMAEPRGGVDLNKPTGRIYTEDDLLAVLKKSSAKP